MNRAIAGVASLCMMSAQPVLADQVAASKCAASLQPQARLVFEAVAARPQPQSALRVLLEARVRELVFTDRLMISAARPAAEAASECLRIARNCVAENC